MNGLILIVAMLALLWLLLIRPQRRRQQEQARMLREVKVGDEIVTAGGVYGTVESLADDELMLRIAPGTTVRLARRAVAGVFPPEEAVTEADDAQGLDETVEPGAESDSSGALRR